jgi:hypothetical protein
MDGAVGVRPGHAYEYLGSLHCPWNVFSRFNLAVLGKLHKYKYTEMKVYVTIVTGDGLG